MAPVPGHSHAGTAGVAPAFGSTWEAEAARKDENWSARITAATDWALLVVCRNVLHSQEHYACDANQVEQGWLACRRESEFGQ